MTADVGTERQSASRRAAEWLEEKKRKEREEAEKKSE